MTGVCSNPVKADGSSCNDGNGCTQTDTCLSGACMGADPVTCTALDACHEAGTCDPMTGACSHPVRPSGTLCGAKNCDANGTWHDEAFCDANGGCVPKKTDACAPFQCTLQGCDKSCEKNSDCPAGPVCQRYFCNPIGGGVCTLAPMSDGTPCGMGGGCIAGMCYGDMSTSSSSSGSGSSGSNGSGSGGASGGAGGLPEMGGMGGTGGIAGGMGGEGGGNHSPNGPVLSGSGCTCQTGSTDANGVWGFAVGLALMAFGRKRRKNRVER